MAKIIDFDTPTMGMGVMGMGMGGVMVQPQLYRLAQPSFTGAWAELGNIIDLQHNNLLGNG